VGATDSSAPCAILLELVALLEDRILSAEPLGRDSAVRAVSLCASDARRDEGVVGHSDIVYFASGSDLVVCCFSALFFFFFAPL
jgi:hypothetical protein